MFYNLYLLSNFVKDNVNNCVLVIVVVQMLCRLMICLLVDEGKVGGGLTSDFMSHDVSATLSNTFHQQPAKLHLHVVA